MAYCTNSSGGEMMSGVVVKDKAKDVRSYHDMLPLFFFYHVLCVCVGIFMSFVLLYKDSVFVQCFFFRFLCFLLLNGCLLFQNSSVQRLALSILEHTSILLPVCFDIPVYMYAPPQAGPTQQVP